MCRAMRGEHVLYDATGEVNYLLSVNEDFEIPIGFGMWQESFV